MDNVQPIRVEYSTRPCGNEYTLRIISLQRHPSMGWIHQAGGGSSLLGSEAGQMDELKDLSSFYAGRSVQMLR